MDCRFSSRRQRSDKLVTVAGEKVTQTNQFWLYIILEK